MKLPVGKIKGEELDKLFSESIKYHEGIFIKTIAEYEPIELYSHWRTLIRSIDEIINIAGELKTQVESDKFLSLDFDFLNPINLPRFKDVIDILNKSFENNVAERFSQIALMSSAINKSYQSQGIFNLQGGNLNLSTTINSIAYFQSRRLYYVTTLLLIPQVANGSKKITYLDLLNYLQYPIDSCMVGITTSYYSLLLNQCLTDYEMDSDGTIAKGNFDFSHLEGFFMEPERLSLIDQMELRPDIIIPKKMLPKSDNKVFSFSEVANAMSLFEGAFDKYKIDSNTQFKELNMLFYDISIFVSEDFNIIIDEASFSEISLKYKSLVLTIETTDYFIALNSFAPFQKLGKYYFSTVVLLTRFVYRTLSTSLLKNKTFQIHSGFIFEDKVAKILAEYGFALTNITRINHKEFDLITIKDNKVYNFQCKNNFLDISRVDYNYKKIGKLNRLLCRYYKKALIKEVQRESLVIKQTGINNIEHFVISRYPVITRNEKIINFKDLDSWTRKRTNA
jgi:hypothetical protein